MKMQTLALPADSRSVAAARSFVSRVACEHLEDPFAASLLTSELVSNVVSHAPHELTVGVDAGPPFRVEVHDGTVATPVFRDLIAHGPAPVPPDAPGGRGLVLLHALADRVGLDEGVTSGKVVWFEL